MKKKRVSETIVQIFSANQGFSLRTVCVALVSAGLLTAPAVYGDSGQWQAQFAPEVDSVRQPRDPLRIFLPDDFDASKIGQLRLVLDKVDMTQVMRIEGRQLILEPGRPLKYGQHMIALLEKVGAKTLERGSWPFEVRQSDAVREMMFSSKATLNIKQRASDRGYDENDLPEHRAQADGAIKTKGRVSGKDWQVKAKANFIYNSLPELTPAGRREFDIGKFQVQGNYQNLGFNIGDHRLEPEGLLIKRFRRRGISSRFKSKDKRLMADVFAMRTGRVVGLSEGLGFSDPENRTLGGGITFQPFIGTPEKLSLTTTYLSGKTANSDDFATISGGLKTDTNAWSVAARSTVMDKRLYIAGEYARARQNATNGLADTNDDAVNLLVRYRPKTEYRIAGSPVKTSLGLQYLKVGDQFESPANAALAVDRELVAFVAKAQWVGLTTSLYLASEEDNVDGTKSLPTRRKDVYKLATRYKPKVSTGDMDKEPWYGQPTYNVELRRTKEETVNQPNPGGLDIDNRIQDISVFARFNHSRWNGLVRYKVGWLDDFSDFNPDTKNQLFELEADVSISDRFSLSSRAQYNLISTTGEPDSSTVIVGLTGDIELIPSRLDLNLDYEISDTRLLDNSESTRDNILSANLNWQAIPARSNKPGLSFWLQVSHQSFNDKVFDDADLNQNQVFVGATLSWPYRFPVGN
ncbi:MAG: hypothetical protein GXP09_05690 [Gammaproteobacteria bacterium]|nr:hypothetical protein [Gammaproteobacteria bacterium]